MGRHRREVLSHVPDVWIDEGGAKIGYEISFTRAFYRPPPMRSLEEIRADILALEQETDGLPESILFQTEDTQPNPSFPRKREQGWHNHAQTTGRQHPSQQTQRHPLNRRHQRPGQARLATQKRRARRLYEKIRRPYAGLLRNARKHDRGHRPRETAEEMEPRMENRTDRKGEPAVARSMAGSWRLTMAGALIPRCGFTGRGVGVPPGFPLSRE